MLMGKASETAVELYHYNQILSNDNKANDPNLSVAYTNTITSGNPGTSDWWAISAYTHVPAVLMSCLPASCMVVCSCEYTSIQYLFSFLFAIVCLAPATPCQTGLSFASRENYKGCNVEGSDSADLSLASPARRKGSEMILVTESDPVACYSTCIQYP